MVRGQVARDVSVRLGGWNSRFDRLVGNEIEGP